MTEKRNHERSAIELAASHGIPDDPRVSHEAKINNISQTGFCFRSLKELKAGSEIELVINCENNENVNVLVRVVWSKVDDDTEENIYGVRITEKPGPRLEKFLEFYNLIQEE